MVEQSTDRTPVSQPDRLPYVGGLTLFDPVHGAHERMKAIAAHVGSMASRVVALDALRGITVIGMILVNTAAFLHDPEGLPAYPLLLHSTWAGFTIADAVFPSFILMVGVSVACSLAGPRIVGGDVRAAATARSRRARRGCCSWAS
jgi:hypothetical protein